MYKDKPIAKGKKMNKQKRKKLNKTNPFARMVNDSVTPLITKSFSPVAMPFIATYRSKHDGLKKRNQKIKQMKKAMSLG